jgi:hypothetical protein
LTNKTIDTASNTITGAVTLTGTQTLTNKTLTSPALTTPTISTATTNGDILYGTGSGALSRLGIGSTNQVLGVTGGVPAYQASSKSTLTTTGDIMYASAANTPARLGIGSSAQVLTVASGVPSWATPAAASYTWTTYTPSLNQITLGNGTLVGRYVEITTGTIAFSVRLTIGSTTSFNSSYSEISLPFATKQPTMVNCWFYDYSTNANFPSISPVISTGNSGVSLRVLSKSGTYVDYTAVYSAVPFSWAVDDYIILNGVYEKQ